MRPGDFIANRFEIAARAGSGGMGTVYRGRDQSGDRDVAIKVLRRDVSRDAERFDQEARLLASLSHPHIVEYVSHGLTMTGERYLVMEWVDGETLTGRLAEEGLTLAQSVAVMRRVAEAVGYAHDRGVIHRDLTPGNVLFPGGDAARVKVIDFGIAVRPEIATRLTESGTVLGTPSYMAPEQARSARRADARSDVFSIGCVLYECLTGAVAFAGSNPLAVRAKTLLVDPPRARALNPEVPPALDELVAAVLAKDPEHRPAHARAVAEELAALSSVPEGRRIRRVTEEAVTRQLEADRALGVASTEVAGPPVALILAAVPEDYAHPSRPPAAPEGLKRRLADVVARFAGHLEDLAGRSSMVVLTGAPGEAFAEAERAARCALAVREACPELSLAISLGDAGSLGGAIERGARTMDGAVRRAILDRGLDPGRAEAGEIRLDSRAAAVLGDEFHVRRTDSKTYLLDE